MTSARDGDTVSVATDDPAVERTANRVALDATAVAEMRAEVRAMRVEDPRDAVRRPERDQVTTEVPQRSHGAARQVGTGGDAEPSIGER